MRRSRFFALGMSVFLVMPLPAETMYEKFLKMELQLPKTSKWKWKGF